MPFYNNIRLVKLSSDYKNQLFEMMDEWTKVKENYSPHAIFKNDYHNFDYYLDNLDYKKEIESTAGNSESLTRFGENKRSFEDEAEIVARPFASRIFYRAVETVMSFWDWLRGKIREANYVVTLYTPVFP